MTPQRRLRSQQCQQQEANEPRLACTIENVDRLRAELSQARQENQRLKRTAKHTPDTLSRKDYRLLLSAARQVASERGSNEGELRLVAVKVERLLKLMG
jgi:hypothetical protein